jgi:hypothetical protein
LPEPEGHSRTAFPPASRVFFKSHMYAYCSEISMIHDKGQTGVYSRIGEEDG